MSVAQRPFLTASDRPEQPDQTGALDGARSNELETPVKVCPQPVHVEGFVTEQCAEGHTLDQRRYADSVVSLAG